MKIGNVTFEYGLFLAPLAGVTDRAFREICVRYGAEGVCSEMISAKGLHYNDKKTALLAEFTEEEAPFAVQIFGSDPDIMAESAKRLVNNDYPECRNTLRPSYVDINMGCPMPKITKNGDGSALMKVPALACEIVRSVKSAIDVPLTVKIRAGWDKSSKNAPDFAEKLAESGADAIFVHGRTREGMYTEQVDCDIIKNVKSSVDVPVIANGGIFSADDAERVFEYTGCDGVMIARGALGYPFIFSEIRSRLSGQSYIRPSFAETLEVALTQARNAVRYKGEYTAVSEMRKHLSWYIKGERGSAEARRMINSASTLAEIERIVNGLILLSKEGSE